MRRLQNLPLVTTSAHRVLCLALRVSFCATLAFIGFSPIQSFGQTTNPESNPGAHQGLNQNQNSAQNKDDKSEKMLQRLEQLFIWRVSDRLSLTPQQETNFSNEFRKISEERSTLSRQLDSLLDQIEKEKGNTTKEVKLIADYEVTLKKYNQCQTKEMDVMRHLFDTKKMVDYMLLKREMSLKIKDVLVQPRSSKEAQKPNLKEPQVIQEK